MKRYINCIAHNTSEGNLLLGETGTALFDCGMQFCADETIRKVKAALGGRPLDYVFATHTHYDHIGALPAFRKVWPALKLVTCEAGASVLLKDTPRRVIRELSNEAGNSYVPGYKPLEYDYNDFIADVVVKDGDSISLGGVCVTVIETPGHTRDSLSFYIPETGLLITSETPGVLMPNGEVYPTYLVSYKGALEAVDRCSAIPFQYLSLPHRGVVAEKTASGYLKKAKEADIDCHHFIVEMHLNGLNEEQILDAYEKKYGSESVYSVQPKFAFLVNAKATIACTLKEYHAEAGNKKARFR